jgi:uncharacterized protein YbjT (DUF2867 family)
LNILITGASRFIGQNLTQTLKAIGHQVISVSRGDGLNFSTLPTPAAWLSHLQGVNAVMNAVGIISQQGTQQFDLVHTRAPNAMFQACI